MDGGGKPGSLHLGGDFVTISLNFALVRIDHTTKVILSDEYLCEVCDCVIFDYLDMVTIPSILEGEDEPFDYQHMHLACFENPHDGAIL